MSRTNFVSSLQLLYSAITLNCTIPSLLCHLVTKAVVCFTGLVRLRSSRNTTLDPMERCLHTRSFFVDLVCY